MQLCSLVEIWRTRPEWFGLSRAQRQEFLNRGQQLIEAVSAKGAKLIGIHRCRAISENGWDLFAYWQMPNIDVVVELAEGLDRMGWNRYFEQINFVGKTITAEQYFSELLGD
jgi:hypothetical protein